MFFILCYAGEQHAINTENSQDGFQGLRGKLVLSAKPICLITGRYLKLLIYFIN